MAETYDIAVSIKVLKTSSKEPIVDEQTFFNAQTFAKLATIANDYYQLIATLNKLK